MSDMVGVFDQSLKQQEVPAQALLPVRPRPWLDEAAVSYLIRVAQANGFSSVRQLWQVCQTEEPGKFLDSFLQKLNIPRSTWSSLVGPFPHLWKIPAQFAQGLCAYDYNYSLMRWCPVCLSEELYLRGNWGLKLHTVCLHHQVFLVDKCPSCGAKQRIGRIDLEHCPCGAKLRASQRRTAPAEIFRLSCRLMEGSMDDGSGEPRLSMIEWHRLVRYLGQFTPESWPAHPGQVTGLHHLERASMLIWNTAELLNAWPDHFDELIASIQAHAPSSHSLVRTFKPLYSVLYQGLSEPGFQFLRDAFEDYLHTNWWGLVCRRNRRLNPSTITNHPSMTLKQVAKSAGTSPAIVRHLVQAELIPIDVDGCPTGRQRRSIHQREIGKIATLTQGALYLKEAASALALSERRIRELVAAGILKPVFLRSEQQSAAWLFSRDAIAHLGAIPGTSNFVSETVTLDRILRTWRLREGEFPQLVQAIANGTLPSTQGVAQPIGKVTLDLARVRAWLRQHRGVVGGGISVDEAARYLGIKQQVAYQLVANRLLGAVGTASGIRISSKDLKAFQANFISLAELARHHGRSPRSVLKTTIARPVCGPTVDGSRQYFFRRRDLAAADMFRDIAGNCRNNPHKSRVINIGNSR